MTTVTCDRPRLDTVSYDYTVTLRDERGNVMAFVYGDTPEHAAARARQFAAAAAAIDACSTYHMAMQQDEGPTQAQWEFIGEKVRAVMDAAKGGA